MTSVLRFPCLLLVIAAVGAQFVPRGPFEPAAAHAQNAVVVAKGVQTGTVTFGAGTADIGFNSGTSSYPAATVTLGKAVDSTKAFVHCTFSLGAVNVPSALPTCELSNTQVTITIAATAAIVVPAFLTVRWYVVEFEGSVVVQRGTAAFTTAQSEPGAALVSLPTAVDCAKSFVLTTARMTSTSATIDQQWTTTATLTGSGGSAPRTACTSGNTSSLEIFRNATGTALTVAWQVIQIEGITVQRGTACIGPTATPACPLLNTTSGLVQGRSQGVSLGTAVTTSKAWILTSRRAGSSAGGNDGLYTARVDFSCDGSTESGSCLRFDRGAAPTGGTSNTQVDFTWEVISLNDTTTSIGRVERKNGYVATLFTTGASTTNITSNTNFSSNVFQGRAVPFFSVSNDRVNNSSDLVSVSLTVKVNQSNLTFDRPSGGTRTETIAWQVVEFFSCDTDPTLCHVSASALSGTTDNTASVTISWWPVFYASGTQCFVAGTASTTPLGPSTCNVLVLRSDDGQAIVPSPALTNGSNTPQGAGANGKLWGGGSCNGTNATFSNPCIVLDGTATTAATTLSVTDSNLQNSGTRTYTYKVYIKSRALTPTWTTLTDSLSSVSVTPKKYSASGGMQWVYAASGGATVNSPIEDFGDSASGLGARVYANSSNNKFLSINSNTGGELADPVTMPGPGLGYASWWPPAPPGTRGAQVIVGDKKGYVTSFDGTTGQRIWTRKIHTDSSDASGNADIDSAVSVQLQRFSNQTFKDTYNSATYSFYTGDVVFAATKNATSGGFNQNNKIYALRATDGTTLWTFDPNNVTNCSPARPMDIVPGQPAVDYYGNRLLITTEDGFSTAQNSLWVISTLGPDGSGASNNCNGMLVASVGSLRDIDSSIWQNYDGSRFYFQNSDCALFARAATGTAGPLISDSTVISANTTDAAPGCLIRSSVWQDYYKYLEGQSRLYFVTQNGGVWCVDEIPGVDFDLCTDWPTNPVYIHSGPVVNGNSSGATLLGAPMLLEPHFWAGGQAGGTGDFGKGVLFQISTVDGSLEKTFTVDSSSNLGDLSTSTTADALYLGSSGGRLFRINLNGVYGSLP
jgi:hypothetical protein